MPSVAPDAGFCRWTMLGGALRTLGLSGGGKRERGGAMGRGGPARGGGGGIPVESERTNKKMLRLDQIFHKQILGETARPNGFCNVWNQFNLRFIQ